MAGLYNAGCPDVGGACPGNGPLKVCRGSGKDAMPFRQGALVTTTMADFIPPAVGAGYLGATPTLAASFNATYGGEVRQFFTTLRHQVLCQQVRPKFLYGRLPCDFSPFPDVVVAQRGMDWARLSQSPAVRPTNVDPMREGALRNFHAKVVSHRDYYLDKTDKLHPEPLFTLGSPYPVPCPVDERVFKIKRRGDSCDGPGFLGSPSRCNALPCAAAHGLLLAVKVPRLPRPPFMCGYPKPRDPNEHQVLLV